MNNESLKSLHDYLKYLIDENNIIYDVWEMGVLDLYNKMIAGTATRKDFLIFAICDMASELKRSNIAIKNAAWGRFLVTNKKYIEKEWENLTR